MQAHQFAREIQAEPVTRGIWSVVKALENMFLRVARDRLAAVADRQHYMLVLLPRHHLDSTDLVEFRKKFEAIPVPMVIDHMGRMKAADGLEQEPFRVLLDFMRLERFWVKVCGAERVSSKGPP